MELPMNKTKIKIELSGSLFPVQAYFNSIPDEKFLKVLVDFSNGIGSGFEETSICFENESEYEQSFKGVEFGLFNQEVIISNEEFIKVLKAVSSIYQKDYPEFHEEVEILLNKIENFFLDRGQKLMEEYERLFDIDSGLALKKMVDLLHSKELDPYDHETVDSIELWLFEMGDLEIIQYIKDNYSTNSYSDRLIEVINTGIKRRNSMS